VGGWVEKSRLRLNSAQFQLKLPVGAELGKNEDRFLIKLNGETEYFPFGLFSGENMIEFIDD
jgi:hypothetical protein